MGENKSPFPINPSTPKMMNCAYSFGGSMDILDNTVCMPCLCYMYILWRASEAGSLKNCLGSGQQQNMDQ